MSFFIPYCTNRWNDPARIYLNLCSMFTVKLESSIGRMQICLQHIGIYSPRFAWGGGPHRKFFGSPKMLKHIVFYVILQCYISKKPEFRRFWAYKVGPKHWFLLCFQCYNAPKRLNTLLFTMFFSYLSRFLGLGRLPKRAQIPVQHSLTVRCPKIVQKSRKHHPIPGSVQKQMRPPPAKADIATAILTNVT